MISQRSRKIISRIASYFERNKFKDICGVKPVLITGWPGDGKTTIAIEFAYKFGLQFTTSLYIDCSTSIVAQYEQIATDYLLIEASKEITDPAALRDFHVNAVIDYIQTCAALILYDNVEDADGLEKFLPRTGRSRVLLLSTNYKLTNSSVFRVIRLSPLGDRDVLLLLGMGYKIERDEIPIALKIGDSLGRSPFALELVNAYLREYSDIELERFYEEIKVKTIKWEGLSRKETYHSIHHSSSVIALIEHRIERLDDKNELDSICKKILCIIGCLDVAGEWISDKLLKEMVGMTSINMETLTQFSNIKNRITRIGLGVATDYGLVLHSLTLEYIKEFLLTKSEVESVIDRFIEKGGELIKKQIELNVWAMDDVFCYLKPLVFYYIHKFEFVHSQDIIAALTYLLCLNEGLQHYCRDEESIEVIDLALQLAALDTENPYADFQESSFLFHKAKALHKLDRYEEAWLLYRQVSQPDRRALGEVLIESYIFMGHISRMRRDGDAALSFYQHAFHLCAEMKEHVGTETYLSLIYTSRILLSVECLAKEFSMSELEKQVGSDLQLFFERLKQVCEPGGPEFDRNDPSTFPFEIAQQLLDPCTVKPAVLRLRVLPVRLFARPHKGN